MSDPGGAPPLAVLLDEYALAQAHSLALVDGLDAGQLAWRPHEHSSAIAWHLGHQGAVNHYLLRNLTAAEASVDPDLDLLFDSATPEPERGDVPALETIIEYRDAVAVSTRYTIGRIADADRGAVTQMGRVADRLMRALIDHEYQHATWITEVRATMLDAPAPQPASGRVVDVDGYWMLATGGAPT